MRFMMTVGIALSLALGAVPACADSKPAAPAKDSARRAGTSEGWPETSAGERARRWVEAFSTGEAAMREFLANEMAPKSLESRGSSQRIESYRGLRERYGKLSLGTVVKSTPAELTARLLASDGSLHTFVFTVEPEPPHRLVSVGLRQRGHGGWFGGHH